MGKQYNKVIKRSRRKAYLVRKKTLAKQGVTRRSSRIVKASGDEEAVKKPKKSPVKKSAKPAAKKAEEAAPAES